MQKMTKRERVERTMNLQETDRVPIYDLVRCDAFFEHFSGKKLPFLAEDRKTEEKLLQIVGNSLDNFLDMTRDVGFGPTVEKDLVDELGFTQHYSIKEKTSWIAKRPFADEKGAIEFLKKWILIQKKIHKELKENPAVFRKKWHDNFLKTQGYIGETVNLLACQGTGLDELRHNIGLDLFSYIECDDPGLLSEFLEVTTNYRVEVCHIIADKTLSPAVLTFGDIACKNMLLHSPGYLRREFFPRLKKINEAWHEHGIKCLFHSDGYLMEIMDDLVASGIDGLNPIETVAGMNLKEVKEKYGKKLFLTGGIDMSQLLSRGTPEQVRAVCEQALKDASPGYFIGSTTEIDNSAKLENIIAMYETVNK